MNVFFGRSNLRVLMYHKIDPQRRDMLTVSTNQLEEHLQYLHSYNYQIVGLNDVLHQQKIAPKAVLIAFDDAYQTTLEYAYPILKKYNAKATIFVPTCYVGKGSDWDIIAEPLMAVEELQNIDKEVFTLALHTHKHQHFAKLSAAEIKKDIEDNIDFFRQHNIGFAPALSYPYGGRPTDKNIYENMIATFKKLGIQLAFRIGNRINAWPLKNPFEVQRLDIRGTDSMEVFKRKVRWGKIF